MPGKKDIVRRIERDHTLTEFQKKTYKAVLDIPKGETRTYLWIARRIAGPGSARAVGNALNRNPYAPEVPCHRVISSDGGIGGYSGGIRKKVELLRKESKAAKGIAE